MVGLIQGIVARPCATRFGGRNRAYGNRTHGLWEPQKYTLLPSRRNQICGKNLNARRIAGKFSSWQVACTTARQFVSWAYRVLKRVAPRFLRQPGKAHKVSGTSRRPVQVSWHRPAGLV